MMEQAHLWREGRRVAGKRRRPFLHCWGIFRFTIIVSITNHHHHQVPGGGGGGGRDTGALVVAEHTNSVEAEA